MRSARQAGQELAGVPDPPHGNFQSAGPGGWARAHLPTPGLLGLPQAQQTGIQTVSVCCPQGRAGPGRPHPAAAPEPSSGGPRLSEFPQVLGLQGGPLPPPGPLRPPGRAHPQASAASLSHLPPAAHTSESSAIPAQPRPAAALPFPATRGGWHPGFKVARENPQEGSSSHRAKALLLQWTVQAPDRCFVLFPRFPGELSVAQRGQGSVPRLHSHEGEGEEERTARRWAVGQVLSHASDTPSPSAVASLPRGPWHWAPRRCSASWLGEF